MPYHSSRKDLQLFLKEKELFNEERWRKLEDFGLTTLEEIAHFCSNGDIQQPQNEDKLLEMVKEVEGDWEVPTEKVDNFGEVIWKVKPEAEHKNEDDLEWDDYEPEMTEQDFPHALVNKWRIVVFHARTQTINAEALRTDKGEDGSAPKISMAERIDRREKVKEKFGPYFPGVMERTLLPGKRCEDMMYAFAYHNRIERWPDPALCTSQDQEEEKENERRDRKRFDDDEKNTKGMKRPTAQIDTRLELIEAMQRRGLAMHCAGLLKYRQHEEWTARLRHAMDPVNTSGFVTVANAVKADRELWTLIRSSTSKGIRREGNGTYEAMYPIYEAMQKHMNQYQVDRLLLPTNEPKRGGKRGRSASSDSSDGEEKPRKKRTTQEWRPKRFPKGKGKGKGKSWKGKGKGKFKGSWGGRKGKGKGGYKSGGKVPKELKGLAPTTKAGARKCFDWNMKCGCKHAKGGKACWNGLHVCMKCGAADHGAEDCPKKG